MHCYVGVCVILFFFKYVWIIVMIMQMHNMNMWLNAFCVFVHLHINTKPVHFGFVEENTLAVTALLSPPPPPLCPLWQQQSRHLTLLTDSAEYQRLSLCSSSHQGQSAGRWREKTAAYLTLHLSFIRSADNSFLHVIWQNQITIAVASRILFF